MRDVPAIRDDLLAHGYAVRPDLVPAAVTAAAVEAVRALHPPDTPGPRFTFPTFEEAPELGALWTQSPALRAAVDDTLDLVGEPAGGQLALTYPPFPRAAGRPHVDGTVGDPGGRPGTFSVLVGFPLTDQSVEGGLWVWPGSHREHAAHFAAFGPEAFWSGDPGYPDVTRAAPVQLSVEPGDVTFCHYLLGHCPGGVTRAMRATFYLRLTAVGHAEHWREAMTDVARDLRPARAR